VCVGGAWCHPRYGVCRTSARCADTLSPLCFCFSCCSACCVSALGDMVAKTAGVISTPFRASRSLKSSQKVLVVASDGLWDFVPNEEAILIATQANDSRTAAVSVSRVACRVSRVACRVSRVACRVSRVACRVSRVACRVSP
jgi:hypothetical protein